MFRFIFASSLFYLLSLRPVGSILIINRQQYQYLKGLQAQFKYAFSRASIAFHPIFDIYCNILSGPL